VVLTKIPSQNWKKVLCGLTAVLVVVAVGAKFHSMSMEISRLKNAPAWRSATIAKDDTGFTPPPVESLGVTSNDDLGEIPLSRETINNEPWLTDPIVVPAPHAGVKSPLWKSSPVATPAAPTQRIGYNSVPTWDDTAEISGSSLPTPAANFYSDYLAGRQMEIEEGKLEAMQEANRIASMQMWHSRLTEPDDDLYSKYQNQQNQRDQTSALQDQAESLRRQTQQQQRAVEELRRMREIQEDEDNRHRLGLR
jgi:hypothetical protein